MYISQQVLLYMLISPSTYVRVHPKNVRCLVSPISETDAADLIQYRLQIVLSLDEYRSLL